MACSIESTRTYIEPSWLDNSLAIVVFPVPGSPPKMISIGDRLSGACVLKIPIRRSYLESKLFRKIGFRDASLRASERIVGNPSFIDQVRVARDPGVSGIDSHNPASVLILPSMPSPALVRDDG